MRPPWSNGTEWMAWEAANCDRCALAATAKQMESGRRLPCPIQDAILRSMATEDIPQAIADRAGMDEHNSWFRCKEFTTERPRRPRRPRQRPGQMELEVGL